MTLIGTPARTCGGIKIRSVSRTTGGITGVDTVIAAFTGGGAMTSAESVDEGGAGGTTATPMPLSMPRASSCSTTPAGKPRVGRAGRRRDATVSGPRLKNMPITTSRAMDPSRHPEA